MSSSLLYTPGFKYPDRNFRKNQDFMDLNHHHHDYHRIHDHNHYEQQQIQNHDSGLMRFRSASSSFLENLVNGGNSGGVGEDYPCFRSSSPETDTIFTRFMNGSGVSGTHDLHEYGERSMKQEVPDSPKNQIGFSSESSEMIYQSLRAQSLENETKMDCSFGVVNSMMENSVVPKMGSGSGNNLLTQNSSPAGIFSDPGADNGFSMARDLGNFGASGGIKGEVSSMTCRLNSHVNFASSSSRLRLMPQIAEAGDECIGASIPENGSLGNSNSRHIHSHLNFANDTWEDTSFNSLKRVRESDGNTLSGLNHLESQTGKYLNGTLGLSHHLNLPKTSAEMAAIVKFLQFQGTVPCNIRAKRGFATHPRSISERMRRTRISERMRKLQELFPEMDKQTNTVDRLDLAVQYIKDLQKQVKMLTNTKARCTCLSKQMQYSNASV
ncbi:transcription factor bHLH [Tripterygium wilfordii]|uniref:Transcription factor bHLH n=1 Tax=Tripterygium wilfordii TaxID=458696 RepID=A0A7J7CWI1_TRIWF|nr:transcription factor bHLH130-like [Tripterygium wilfordii]XP_038719606.1 transcription factor bHLH130-like [Tripterygium wilfordii]KAF5738368.1 transcription factor bHLH [Tripterygium wilfordii]